MLAFYAYVYLSDINPPKEIESGGSYWDHWSDKTAETDIQFWVYMS
jgi:hypothetical protein